MSDDNRMTLFFELKEKAKWSSDPEEKKAAIKEYLRTEKMQSPNYRR